MKKLYEISDMPDDLLELIITHYGIELEDDDKLSLEDIYDIMIDTLGYDNDNKRKKVNDYYYLQSSKKFGKYNVIAQTKRYIKDYDCICDEQYDCIYID